MIVVEYEAYSYKLARYATSILDTEYARVCSFVRRLRLPIRMSNQSLVIVGRSFGKVSDHAWVIKEMHCKGCEGSDMRPRFQGNSVGVIVVLDPEIEILRVGILHIYPISLKVILVDLFRQRFKFMMKVTSVLVITQVRAMVSL